LAFGALVQAQNTPFSSGSTGHEGALNVTAAGVTYFDPVAMNLNPVIPGIFNFTTISVASGSTLKFTENKYHGAVYFLASGDVNIAGTLDLSGDASYGAINYASQRLPNAGGSGGFSGGLGGFGVNAPLAGNGPGGGAAVTSTSNGIGGSNASNQFLVPLFGGGGGGGATPSGAIGGGGGGALLIAGSTTITVTGSILATGGIGYGGNFGESGAGGGGSIRLVSNSIGGSGTVNVKGGIAPPYNQGAEFGQDGLARFESNDLSGISVTGPTNRSLPFGLNLPTTGPPTIKVVSINGQAINSNPFSFPDTTINSSSAVPFVIQAQNIPVGTIAKIYIFSEAGPDQVINIGPLVGTAASSTATANITYPAGGSRGYVKATW
jgi:hypothetical protein